jgi:hypothetical protein
MDHEQLARSESRNVSMADRGADGSLAASVRAGSGPGRARAFGALAIGALAFGALALGALAIGRLAVGLLVVRKSRIRRLEVDELDVNHLRLGGLEIARRAGRSRERHDAE